MNSEIGLGLLNIYALLLHHFMQITPEYILDVSQRLYSIPVQDSGIGIDTVRTLVI